jgi:hypothetical protein
MPTGREFAQHDQVYSVMTLKAVVICRRLAQQLITVARAVDKRREAPLQAGASLSKRRSRKTCKEQLVTWW